MENSDFLFRNFRDFMSLSKEVTKALKNTGYLPDINGEASASATSAETSNPEDSNESPEEPIIEDDPQPGPSGISTAAASGSSSTRYSAVLISADFAVVRFICLDKICFVQYEIFATMWIFLLKNPYSSKFKYTSEFYT